MLKLISFPNLPATRLFPVLMFSQISVMTTFTNVASASSFRRKDMQIANILQSTFMNTTNVLFLLDDQDDSSRNFLASSASVVIELAIKLFSHQKTIQILALNNFPDLLNLDRKKLKKNSSVIGILATARKRRPDSRLGWGRGYSSGNMQFNYRRKREMSHAKFRKKRKGRNKWERHRSYKRKSDTPLSQQGAVSQTLVAGTPLSEQMNFNLGAMTSIVIILRNSEALNSLKSFPINIPLLVKVIFFYDECVNKEDKRAEDRMQEFSENLWLKFRIIFAYFVLFCPKEDLRSNPNCNSQNCSRQDDAVLDNNTMTADGLSSLLWNQFEDKDNRILFQSENIRLVHSLYVYNPFSIKNPASGNYTQIGSELHKFGELKKIDLNRDFQTTEKNLGKAVKLLFNANGQNLRVAAFTSPNTIAKSDFRFLARHLTPELLENPFNSLDSFVGPEVVLMQELARKLNFTIQLVPVSDHNAYGWKLDNGTFVGTLGDLLYNRADLCVNGFFVKDYESERLLFTTSILDDKICVAVKTPELIPRSLMLFKVFTASVWILLMATFVVTAILYTILLCIVNKTRQLESLNSLSLPSTPDVQIVMRTKPHERKLQHKGPSGLEGKQQLPFKSSNQLYNRISTIVSQCSRIIAIILNASVSHPFDSSSYERFFVVLCLLLGLNLTGSFQGSLMDIYTTPREYPSIDTLEQLDKSGMLIILEHTGLQTDVFGTEAPGSILGNLRGKIKATGVPDDTLLAQIGSGQKFAALVRLGDFDRIKFKIPYRSDGKTLIHVIPDCPKTYNLAFLLNKSSELYAAINHYLLLVAAGGLVEKWTRDSVYMFRLHGHLKNRKLLKDSQLILTLSHLQLAFFALFSGLLVSVALFLVEIYWETVRLKRKRAKALSNNAAQISKLIGGFYRNTTVGNGIADNIGYHSEKFEGNPTIIKTSMTSSSYV